MHKYLQVINFTKFIFANSFSYLIFLVQNKNVLLPKLLKIIKYILKFQHKDAFYSFINYFSFIPSLQSDK